jgi:hypothetical protein
MRLVALTIRDVLKCVQVLCCYRVLSSTAESYALVCLSLTKEMHET